MLQVHDRMTEQVYAEPLKSFATALLPMPVFSVPIMEKGAAALQDINEVGRKCRCLTVLVTRFMSRGRGLVQAQASAAGPASYCTGPAC